MRTHHFDFCLFPLNAVHSFAYGFTPETFNFESEDKVLISVQDSQGTNNAFFSSMSLSQ